MEWISKSGTEQSIININAGFDETSYLLRDKFREASLTVLDFYNPDKHTEVSIKRARKAYPPFPGTIQVTTNDLKIKHDSADKIMVILAAHEIRDEQERILFFRKLMEIICPNGLIYITEHLRDIPNFLIYNIGAFHFYSRNNWLYVFNQAGLEIKKETKITPFISTFILGKNGNPL